MSDVLLVGHARVVSDFVKQVRREVHHGMRVVGACVPGGKESPILTNVGVPVVGNFEDIDESVWRTGADAVAVLTCPELDGPALSRLSWELARSGTDLLVAPALIDVAGPRIAIRPICGLPLLHVDEPELTGARRLAKACLDLVAASCALLMLLPLLAAIGVAIRLTGPGPALFRQTRVGLHGREFTMLKFRTMRHDAERQLAGLAHLNAHGAGPLFKIRDDPRVTPIGRWLRRTSLD